jgi:hypothetical protein
VVLYMMKLTLNSLSTTISVGVWNHRLMNQGHADCLGVLTIKDTKIHIGSDP